MNDKERGKGGGFHHREVGGCASCHLQLLIYSYLLHYSHRLCTQLQLKSSNPDVTQRWQHARQEGYNVF